jgi:acetolactate synthase-1/3 small subunit
MRGKLMDRHTISISVINEAGVLSRIVGLFSGRGYNIESLTVAPALDKAYSKVTIVTVGDSSAIEQINKQLNRLIPILKVTDLLPTDSLEAEVAIIKVHAKDEDRATLLNMAQMSESKIVDFSDKTCTLRVVGDEKQINATIELIRPLGIKDIVRSGKVAMSKTQ